MSRGKAVLEGDIKGFFLRENKQYAVLRDFSKAQGKKFQSISILAIRRATFVYSRRHQILWFPKKKRKTKSFPLICSFL